MSQVAELQRRRAVLARQRERVRELDAARAEAARRVERAEAALVDFHREREREAGEQRGE